MTDSTLDTLVLIAVIAAVAPLVHDHVPRWLAVPVIVLEMAFGVLVGPSALGWAREDDVISTFSSIGLAMLMFMAGYEINFAAIRGGPLRLAVLGWLASLVLALTIVAAIRGFTFTTLVVGLALTTTALGTILPILRDSGDLPTPFGARVLAVGAIGEFGPIVAMSVLLTTSKPLHAVLLIAGFVVVAAGAAALARRPASPRIRRLLTATLGTSAQFAVRLALVVIMLLVFLASELGLDILLGAFAAGIVVRLGVATIDEHTVRTVESKLDAIGFGVFIPIFFVVSGMRLDLGSLDTLAALAAVLGYLALFLLVRGGPILLLHRFDLDRRDRVALALFGSSALPLVVVITGIGVDDGALSTSTAAALVLAGALSVLAFPMLATRLRAGARAAMPTPAPPI